MILQIGGILTGLFEALKPGAISLATTIGQSALNVGTQFAEQLVNRELTRDARRDQEDALKAAIRAASNAVSPVVAPGQGPQFSGGPPTGQAVSPPTIIPPGPSPANQAFPINPELAIPQRPPFAVPGGPFVPAPTTQQVFLPQLIQGAITAGRAIAGRAGAAARAFDPRTPIGRRMLGVGAAGVAVETGAQMLGGAAFAPGQAFAPGARFTGIAPTGAPLRITGGPMPNGVATVPTGLPRVGRFQKDAGGVQVQWFFFDGQSMQPIDRMQAARCVKKNCIFRFDVFRGTFVALGSRRMNPMNVRAFFRAGRRVDAAERICRKMFSEKRKQKTGTVRRKSRRKAKR